MIVSRVTKRDLGAAAKVARVGLYRLHAVKDRAAAFRFRLVPLAGKHSELWRRYSSAPFATAEGKRRRVNAVCWHGMRAFMRALYARVPEARVATAFITYTSAAHFEAVHAETAHTQVGSALARVAFAELCEHGYGRSPGSEPDTARLDADYYAAIRARNAREAAAV